MNDLNLQTILMAYVHVVLGNVKRLKNSQIYTWLRFEFISTLETFVLYVDQFAMKLWCGRYLSLIFYVI